MRSSLSLWMAICRSPRVSFRSLSLSPDLFCSHSLYWITKSRSYLSLLTVQGNRWSLSDTRWGESHPIHNHFLARQWPPPPVACSHFPAAVQYGLMLLVSSMPSLTWKVSGTLCLHTKLICNSGGLCYCWASEGVGISGLRWNPCLKGCFGWHSAS